MWRQPRRSACHVDHGKAAEAKVAEHSLAASVACYTQVVQEWRSGRPELGGGDWEGERGANACDAPRDDGAATFFWRLQLLSGAPQLQPGVERYAWLTAAELGDKLDGEAAAVLAEVCGPHE